MTGSRPARRVICWAEAHGDRLPKTGAVAQPLDPLGWGPRLGQQLARRLSLLWRDLLDDPRLDASRLAHAGLLHGESSGKRGSRAGVLLLVNRSCPPRGGHELVRRSHARRRRAFTRLSACDREGASTPRPPWTGRLGSSREPDPTAQLPATFTRAVPRAVRRMLEDRGASARPTRAHGIDVESGWN